MKSSRALYLTALVLIPSEGGEEKIRKVREQTSGNELRDEHGNTRSFYENLEVQIPKFFDKAGENLTDEDGNVVLDPEDLEYFPVDYVCDYSDIQDITDTLDGGSIITFKRKKKDVYVEETVDELFSYIAFISRPWYEKLWDNMKMKWKNFGKKKVDYKEILSRPENQPDYVPPTKETENNK